MSSYNNVRFNNVFKSINVDIELKSKSSLKVDLSNVSTFLLGKSSLQAEAKVESLIALDNLNNTFGGSFNNTKFNSGDRNKYSKATLKGVSRLEDIEGNISAILISKSSLEAVAESENNINTLNTSVGFGGRFNNLQFNLNNRIKYTSISLNSKSKLEYIEGNVSARLESKSNFNGDSTRVRCATTKLNGVSSLILNPNVSVTTSSKLESKSLLIPNIYKFMWSNIAFKSLSNIKAIPIRARFQSISFSSKSNLILNPYIISVENLILNDLGFRPGDVIVIDLDNYYITHNGVDITYKMSGDFFKFYSGLNSVIWNDNVNQRKVRKDIVYQNKFL